MTLIRDAVDLADVRQKLEAIAVDYCYKGGEWKWDEGEMSLTIFNPNGSRFVTLHIDAVH
jgi:hypothetical protein